MAILHHVMGHDRKERFDILAFLRAESVNTRARQCFTVSAVVCEVSFAVDHSSGDGESAGKPRKVGKLVRDVFHGREILVVCCV